MFLPPQFGSDVLAIDTNFVQHRGVHIYISHLRRGPRVSFTRAGLLQMLGPDSVCEDVASAMTKVEKDMRERC